MVRNLENELKTACLEAAKQALNRLASVYASGDVYAFVFFAASGCEALAFAYGTKSELPRKISQLKILQVGTEANAIEVYAEVNAIEWANEVEIAEFLDSSVWEILGEIMSDDSRIDQDKLVEAVLLEVLLDLRHSEILKQPAFASDMLLGMQYPDPSVDQVSRVLHISSVVNSTLWHRKMVAGYGCPPPDDDYRLQR